MLICSDLPRRIPRQAHLSLECVSPSSGHSDYSAGPGSYAPVAKSPV